MRKYFIILAVMLLSLVSVMGQEQLTCVEAKQLGHITGSINGNTATVTNNADFDYTVTLAVYEKFDEHIANQKLHDYQTFLVESGSQMQFQVELPDCAYQIDLACGEVIEDLDCGEPYDAEAHPFTCYGDRKFDYEHVGDIYCEEEEIPEFSVIGAVAVLGVAGLFIAWRRN